MKEEKKNKEQLISELANLRRKLSEVEKELEESKTYIDSMGDALIVIDAQKKIIKMNKTAVKLLGYQQNEILLSSCTELFPRKVHEKHFAEMDAAIKTGTVRPFETVFLTKDGREIPVLASGTVMKNTQGELLGYVGVFKDITERKKAEEALKESEKYLVEAQEIVHMGHWKLDPNTNEVTGSDELYRIFGLSREEATFERFIEMVHPDDREFSVDIIRKGIEYGQDWNFEYRIILKDGTEKKIQAIGKVVTNEAGETVKAVGTVQDITARKRSEEALVSAKSRLEHLIISSPAVIYTCVPHGDYHATYISENIKKQLGYTVEEFLKKPTFWAEHIHPDDKERIFGDLPRLFEKNSHSHEYRFLHKDGSYRWMHDELALTRDSGGTPVEIVGSWIDITAQKQAEEKTRILQSQLTQAQKMEAIGTLAGGIAHDFNNIMTAVKNLTTLALSKAEGDAGMREYLEPVHEISERAINLVQQLLIFSQSRPLESTPLNLNETIVELMDMLSSVVSEDIQIEKELDNNLSMVESDRGRLDQIVTNLIVNSSEAMPQGGKITIRTHNITFSEEEARTIEDATPGVYACLTVEDSGVGMDEETIQHMFEPFFTTKSPKGTGLGLSVVYGIVKELNGWIDASSESGQGTKFRVCLPASTKSKGVVAEEPIKRKTVDGGGKRILLVEDEKWVRKSTAMVLSDNGYKVFEASDAEKAITLFYKKKGRFDLILSDVVMPGRNGIQMLDTLLDINPNIPVLFFSSHVDEKAQLAEIINRGIAYIQKPYEIADLLKAVEETICEI